MATVVILLLVGAILLVLETVLPGLIAGAAGLACLAAGVTFAYRDFGPAVGNLVLLCVVTMVIVMFILWVRFFPHSRVGQLFVARNAIGSLGVEKPELVDKTGEATSALRPSGTALIDGKRVDVVTQGEMIDAGTPVKVVLVEGLRVVVRVA